MPRWVARFNRRVVNPRALERGRWPVLRHVGRTSGAEYRTPVGAIRVDGGYAIVLVYGRRAQWLQNVLAVGRCVLDVGGAEVALTDPRLLPLGDLDAGAPGVPPVVAQRLLGISECVVLDEAG